MKVIIELSPTSYIELFDKCPVRSISYNVIADGYFIRRRGSSRRVFQIVCEVDEARQLYDFASGVNSQAAFEIMTSGGLSRDN